MAKLLVNFGNLYMARERILSSRWDPALVKSKVRALTAALVHLHDTFWLTEAAHEDASPPAMLKRGEKCELPPALVFGGDKDEWVPVELMRSFVADYNKAGGNAELHLYEGANHGFMTGKPDAPYAASAIERMKQFIRKHTTG